MSRKLKFYFIFLLAFLCWFFLPATLFLGDGVKVYDRDSPDKKFKVTVYHPNIVSPISLYKYLKDEDYYFVLYDGSGKMIFKPSLYYGTSEVAAYDAIEFMYGDEKYLFFPGDDGYDSFQLN